MGKSTFQLLANFKDCWLYQSQLCRLSCLLASLLLFWPSSFQLLPLWFANALNHRLVPLVFMLCVSVCCRIGEIALPTGTWEVSAFRVLPFSSFLALSLHYTRNDGTCLVLKLSNYCFLIGNDGLIGTWKIENHCILANGLFQRKSAFWLCVNFPILKKLNTTNCTRPAAQECEG